MVAELQERGETTTQEPNGKTQDKEETVNTPDQMSNDEIFALFRELLNRQETASRSGLRSFPRALPAARDFSPDDLAALRPYVVSMRQGHWDTGGIFNSTPGDVDAIFSQHAEVAIGALDPNKKLKIVLYAHGGLVSEKNGLSQAQFHINWWKQSSEDGIYPVYFVWKTGLGETIAQLLGLAGGVSRDLPSVSRELFTDPIVAEIARRLGGETMWSGMKRDAEQAVQPDGVATYVARRLKEFCDRHQGRVELHAVGHSAGAVFHSHFIPMSTVTGNPFFTTTSFLAPAVRVDAFLTQLTSGGALKPEVGHLAIFTMKKDFEKNDTCLNIYHKSLLYLIFHAFEDKNPTPILGLEESIRGNSDLARIMGLSVAPANAEVIWSKSPTLNGCSATQAISHGDFSSDATTLNSILRRVLGRCSPNDPIHPFPGSRGLGTIWDIWAPPDDLPGFKTGSAEPAEPCQTPTVVTTSKSGLPNVSGNRKALCIGIDAYAPPNRLTGCVHDANNWTALLQANRFDVRTLLDKDAGYDDFMDSLRGLVQASRAGDVLVFTYSGHGTTVPDLTNRTVDGVEEAMVPADFSEDNPKLLMDFDMAGIFNTLPAGVNMTCLIDCCHSGTILRMFGGSSSAGTGATSRARFMSLSPQEILAVQQFQSQFGAVARGNVAGGQRLMREVAFAACLPEEVAMEENGQGDFTRLATGILANGVGSITNQQFQAAVEQAFGVTPRQHPNLDCAPGVESRFFLQPL